MRYTVILLLPLLTGCKSHSHNVLNTRLKTGSIARSERAHTVTVIDSVIRSGNFRFDSLDFTFVRPAVRHPDAPPEVTHIRAYGGHLSDSSRHIRTASASATLRDSTAAQRSSELSSDSRSQRTAIALPGEASFFSISVFALLAALIWFWRRKKV